MHACSYNFQPMITSVGLERTLCTIISRQQMFTDKYVMIYKIYEKP